MDMIKLVFEALLVEDVKKYIKRYGFANESDCTDRYSVIKAREILEVCGKIYEEYESTFVSFSDFLLDNEEIQYTLVCVIEDILDNEFECILSTDSNGRLEKYYYPEYLDFKSMKDFKAYFLIGE